MLLDEAFPKAQNFPRLVKKANVEHILNLGFSRQIEDQDIYNTAVQQERFVVTINFKDFKKLVKKGKPGIIALPSALSNKDVDLVLTDFVSKNNPLNYYGKAIKINDNDVEKIKKRS